MKRNHKSGFEVARLGVKIRLFLTVVVNREIQFFGEYVEVVKPGTARNTQTAGHLVGRAGGSFPNQYVDTLNQLDSMGNYSC